MRHRHSLLVLSLSASFLVGAGAIPLQADEGQPNDATADQLFEQGIQLYSKGDVAGAQKIFRRIDPVQLSKDKRVKLTELVQSDVTRLLADAAEAQKSGDSAKALKLYQAASTSPTATDGQRETANARLADLKRDANASLARSRAIVDDAGTDIKAGRLDAAEAKLKAVKANGQDLGFYDNQRIDQQLAQIAERRRAAAAAPAPSTQPAAAPAAKPAPAAAAAPAPAPKAAPVTIAPPVAEADALTESRRIVAQAKLAEAKAAEQSNDYRKATQLYEESLRLDPANAQTKTAMAAAQAKANADVAPRGLLDSGIATEEIRRSSTTAEFRNFMGRADELVKARNYPAAAEAVSQAKMILDSNKQLLNPTQYIALREEATNLGAKIKNDQTIAQAAQTKKIESDRFTEGQIRKIMALNEQNDEVQRLLKRAGELRKEQNYDKALELVNQALFLQPNNAAASAMKEMIEDSSLYVRTRELMRARDLKFAQHRVESLEAALPYTELMTYPPDWPELTALRLSELEDVAGDSEANRRVLSKLQEPIPVNFEGNKFMTVIDYFKNTTGLDFDVKTARLSDAGIDTDTPVTAQFASVPAEKALRTILDNLSPPNDRARHLDYSISEGTVKVSTHEDLTSEDNLELRVYDVRDLLIETSPVQGGAPAATPAGGAAPARGGGLFPAAGGGGGGGGAATGDRSGSLGRLKERIYANVGYTEDWKETSGSGKSTIEDYNFNLLVRSTASNHKKIRDLLALLRSTRSIQITVESRLLFVNQGFLDEFGMDVDVQINNLGKKWGPIKIGQDSVGFTPVTSDQITRPGSSSGSGSSTSGSTTGSTTGGSTSGTSGSGGATPIGGQTFAPGTGFSSTGNAFDFGVSYLDDLQVNLLLKATQVSTRSVSLTAPRVTFTNGAGGNVSVTQESQGVTGQSATPGTNNVNNQIGTIGGKPAGVGFGVNGTVTSDRRYVILELGNLSLTEQVKRKVQVVQPGGNLQNNGTGNNQNQTGITQQPLSQDIDVADTNTTSISTTVTVPDKGTLLLGGQRLVKDVEVEAGVPVLSKIPILQRLFTNRSSVRDEKVLIVLIKPTILITSEQEEKLFPGLLQDPQKYNVGRVGMGN
ncbi:MAG: hypothetical protein NTW19_17805 [Planctomycetota bacterium]|nr:hypothetical protein [Planctomycetota bacterium]